MEEEKKVNEASGVIKNSKSLWPLLVDAGVFIALFSVIVGLIFVPLAFIVGKEELEDMSNLPVLILSEALTLVSGFLAAWIVLLIRGLPLAGLGLSLRGRWRDLLAGMLFALALYVVSFGLLLLLGAVEVTGVSFRPSFLLLSLAFFLLVAITEELIVRGFILGRMMDGGVNKFVALLVSSVVFSLMHVFNPNFSFVPFLNIILAGCLLGASYIYTRNLCFPIALHWFWNWFQGPVLGYEVSGNTFGDSLLTLHLPTESLINGGTFGFEGSVICSVLLMIGTAIIIYCCSTPFRVNCILLRSKSILRIFTRNC